MSSSFLDGLNPQQREAVTLPRQSALILAGAGSGKTRVLTTRIAWLIATAQATPHGLLAVTFTNKAAREMLTRVSAMLPINTRGMWVGTFHGLCNRLLRMHWQEAGLPQLFTILDSQDQLALVKRLMKGLNIDDEKYPPRQVQYFINGNKEEGLRPSAVQVDDDFGRRLLELYVAYEDACRREGVVDFAELLLRSFELLSRNELLREHYRARFQHILVDEFQDTNRLQYQWLRLLAGDRNAVFAVGDDDQSIYAFRGAHSANMQQFERDFAVERVIKLEQNYRSHGNILDAANALIRQNRTRLGKNLWTADGAGEPLMVYQAASDADEAAFIVDEIRALRSEGVALSDIALLYRSNAQSRVLEHALFSAGLPYRVYGGLRFFERQEVKHALAYLRLTANPHDDGALLRVINFPPRGVGARTLEQLQESAGALGVSLWQAACQRGRGSRGATSGKGVEGFVLRLEEMRAATEATSLAETIEHVIEASGLAAHYKGERDGADRLENLAELVNAATTFAAERDRGLAPAGETAETDQAIATESELMAFLNHAALEAGERQAGPGTDCVQLMTVHSAKGLEFHAVFISGLEEGLFPHENSLTEADGLEEERRLMYVALTRARRRLYLSFAQSRMLHGQTHYHIASRFLQEIPAQLMKRVGAYAAESPPMRHAYAANAAVARSAPHAAQPRPPEAGGLRVGQNVLHPKFGAGVIVGAEGRGGDARVQVSFRHAGVKWLALEYAKLTPA
jgi:DNA helicase-2/ATP-dependent DNA helicase PcrA